MIRNRLFSTINKFMSYKQPQLINKFYQLNRLPFSTESTAAKQQYNKKYMIRLIFKHPSDAYYQTYAYREQFRKQIKQLQDTNKCHIFGGDLFPMQGAVFIVNCDDKVFVQQFFNNKNIYAEKRLIKNVQIQEVQQISNEKMKKLSYYYQYK